MARIRSVKPQLRTSLTAAEWPREVRYFWVLLWGYLDDHGRGVDDVRLIKADCFPLDDDLTRQDIDNWLDMMSKTAEHGDDDEPAVCRYQVKGRRYLHAPKWTEHQRPQHPKPTEIPPCPHHDGGEPSGSSHEDLTKPSGEPHEDPTPEVEVYREVEGGGVEGEGARPPDATPRKRGSRIPDDFHVTSDMVTWAKANAPNVDGRRETEKFINYWRSKTGSGATKLDWPATWRNWMLTAQGDAERYGSRASPGNGRKPSTTDERVNAALDLANEFRTEAAQQRLEITS